MQCKEHSRVGREHSSQALNPAAIVSTCSSTFGSRQQLSNVVATLGSLEASLDQLREDTCYKLDGKKTQARLACMSGRSAEPLGMHYFLEMNTFAHRLRNQTVHRPSLHHDFSYISIFAVTEGKLTQPSSAESKASRMRIVYTKMRYQTTKAAGSSSRRKDLLPPSPFIHPSIPSALRSALLIPRRTRKPHCPCTKRVSIQICTCATQHRTSQWTSWWWKRSICIHFAWHRGWQGSYCVVPFDEAVCIVGAEVSVVEAHVVYARALEFSSHHFLVLATAFVFLA